jgi:ketosteroid isomerase-like protein
MAIDQSKEINAVSAAVEAFRKATIAADKSTLDKLTANELSYGHSSGRLETKAQFIESLTSGKSGFSAIELSDQTITIVDQTALVRHVFNGASRRESANLKLSILTVWLRQQDQWKLVARQAAKL